MRREDRRPLPALLHGSLLAHPLPQVLVLPSPAGGHWHHLLQQRGHDSVSERLHQTLWAQWGVQRLRTVNSSQRDGNEGTGKCLPPQVFQLRHLQKQTDAWRPLPLHQRHNLLRARQTQCCLAQQPPAATSEQFCVDRPEGLLSGSMELSELHFSSPLSPSPATVTHVVDLHHCLASSLRGDTVFHQDVPPFLHIRLKCIA